MCSFDYNLVFVHVLEIIFMKYYKLIIKIFILAYNYYTAYISLENETKALFNSTDNYIIISSKQKINHWFYRKTKGN
jgi:hypothetical protein